MKTVIKILFITALVAGIFSTTQAQQKKRPEKTSSAKAYYGNSPSRPNYKKKSAMVKTTRSQSLKRSKAEARNRNRKKYS